MQRWISGLRYHHKQKVIYRSTRGKWGGSGTRLCVKTSFHFREAGEQESVKESVTHKVTIRAFAENEQWDDSIFFEKHWAISIIFSSALPAEPGLGVCSIRLKKEGAQDRSNSCTPQKSCTNGEVVQRGKRNKQHCTVSISKASSAARLMFLCGISRM